MVLHPRPQARPVERVAAPREHHRRRFARVSVRLSVLFGALMGAERALAAGDSLAHSTHAVVDRALAAAEPAPDHTTPPTAMNQTLTN